MRSGDWSMSLLVTRDSRLIVYLCADTHRGVHCATRSVDPVRLCSGTDSFRGPLNRAIKADRRLPSFSPLTREGEAFLIVYSVTSRASFDRVEKFRTQVARVKDSDTVPVVLVGNKIDRVHEREVETRHGEQLAQRLGGCAFVETSAKTRENLEEAFFTAVRMGGFCLSLSFRSTCARFFLPQGRPLLKQVGVLTGPGSPTHSRTTKGRERCQASPETETLPSQVHPALIDPPVLRGLFLLPRTLSQVSHDSPLRARAP